MKNIKFQHVAVLLALALLVWFYLENKKKANAAAKIVADDKAGTYTSTKTEDTEDAPTNTGGSSGGNIILINNPTTSQPVRYISSVYRNYGSVNAGGSSTPINNAPTGGGTPSGGGNSYNPGTF